MAKRNFFIINPELAYLIRLYCFLKQIPAHKFVEKILDKEMEPYKAWLKNLKELEK